jgi:NTP pyrophosphatase (non-canonical NTP hydrolase)
MNIKKYIRECYEIAQSKGFYPEDSKIEDHLMGIVSEIGEAYEAHRGGKFSNFNQDSLDSLLLNTHAISIYKEYLSGTFEDEIADVFIRLFNLVAWEEKKLFLNKGAFYVEGWTNIPGDLLMIQNQIVYQRDYSFGLSLLYGFCIHHKIEIEKHIQVKIEYNKTREYLHGKQY